MCDEADYSAQLGLGNDYFSATFVHDGFIHATGDPQYLLEAGNHFYKSSPGKWICLEIDVNKLNSKVIYELPAPVGKIEAIDYEEEHNSHVQPRFPHIYGGINKESVTNVFDIVRNYDGEFLSIKGLVD